MNKIIIFICKNVIKFILLMTRPPPFVPESFNRTIKSKIIIKHDSIKILDDINCNYSIKWVKNIPRTNWFKFVDASKFPSFKDSYDSDLYYDDNDKIALNSEVMLIKIGEIYDRSERRRDEYNEYINAKAKWEGKKRGNSNTKLIGEIRVEDTKNEVVKKSQKTLYRINVTVPHFKIVEENSNEQDENKDKALNKSSIKDEHVIANFDNAEKESITVEDITGEEYIYEEDIYEEDDYDEEDNIIEEQYIEEGLEIIDDGDNRDDDISTVYWPKSLYDARDLIRLEDLEFVKMLFSFKFLNEDAPICICGKKMNLNKCSTKCDGVIWICPSKKCRKQSSIRKDTVFSSCHYTLKDCFLIYAAWAANFKILDIAEETGISNSKFILSLCRKFREIAVNKYKQDITSRKLGGKGIIVQIDESAFGRAKYHKGRALKRHCNWIVGAVDTSTKRMALKAVPNRRAATLEKFVLKHILPGTIIHTDGWSGYKKLDQKGYIHKIVEHKYSFVNIDDDGTLIHTQNIESLWRVIKKYFRDQCTYKRKYTNEYLRTWAYRHNIAPSFQSAFKTISND